MSLVLQLGTMEALEELDNGDMATLTPHERPTNEHMNFVVQLSSPTSSQEETIKPTIVYTTNPTKVQVQQNVKNCGSSSPGVVVTMAKPPTVVHPINKLSKEIQKSSGPQITNPQQPPITIAPQLNANQLPSNVVQIISSTTAAPVSVSNSLVQSVAPQQLSKAPTNNLVNSNQPTKVQMYEIAQCNKQQQQQQSSSAILQGMMTHKVIATSMSNIQRINAKPVVAVHSTQATNIQKLKTITSVVNSQGMVTKNFVTTKVQTMPAKSQTIATTTVQGVVLTQPVTTANMQRLQQNAIQKVITNQKPQNQLMNATRINPNHKVNVNQQQQPQQQPTDQSQTSQKVPALQQRVTVQKQPQQQKPQNFPANATNNVAKNSVTGLQKALLPGQGPPKLPNNTQQAKLQVVTPVQKTQTSVVVNNPIRNTSIVNTTGKNGSAPNITKAPTTNSPMTMINKAQLITQSQTNLQHALQLQQIVPQSQCVAKQQTVSLQTQRVTVNTQTTTQPKLNIIQQNTNLTGSLVNQKGSVVVNTKMPSQQTQMLLRMQSGNMKTVTQKTINTIQKNPQATVQQNVNRNMNNQQIKILQQQQQSLSSVVPTLQIVQKQPGCIKTIPAQKTNQRNHVQPKGAGIKTSLNTNMSTLKCQSVNNQTNQPKTNIRTHLPQQSMPSNVMTHKNQTVKIQPQNIQQKQVIVAPQYSQPIVRPQGGQIKTLLPVVSSADTHRDIETKNEPETSAIKEEPSQQSLQSPVRRMPLPYECLQFVLQDHNYGAPPPRTPPPASPPPIPNKQQPLNGAGGSTLQHQFIYNPAVNSSNAADDAASAISSDAGREAEPEGEETETAPEGEGDDEDSITRCICEFEHDDGYMICCDRCLVWQHVDCMGIDRSNIPDEYLCEICRPRRVDRQRARTLQLRKREELMNSDTSSDTSSTSSADTDTGAGGAGGNANAAAAAAAATATTVGGNTTGKKRPNQQQLSVPRRKSDPPPSQLRKLNNNNNTSSNNNNTNNNNNNVAKRQRREQHPRQASASRKKETAKRGPGKRKVKRRTSLDGEEETQDAWGSNMAPLRQWIERYEEAVTNHYSPELRARISSIKVNGTHSDLRQSNISNVANGKCRLNVHSNSLRFLVATMYLPPNTPVLELRGKYMLSTQHRPTHQQGRQHAQRPGPFVFFYRLPREGTEVCVDTRTYGNDARFVRRSCKPNAEIKHCIEKGTLHLYIVTTAAIEKNGEITIRHEQHELMLSPNSSSPIVPLACACGNPRSCQITTTGPIGAARRSSNGALAENADGRERRRRGRRNTVNEDNNCDSTIVNSNINNSIVATTTTISQTMPSTTIITSSSGEGMSTITTITTTSSTTTTTVAATPVTTTTSAAVAKKVVINSTPVTATVTTNPAPALPPTARVSSTKDEVTTPVSQIAQVLPSTPQTSAPQESKKDKKKMTREERKMEAIMKAFERLEKAEQRKQEVQARNAQRKESGGAQSDTDDIPLSQPTKPKQQHLERPMRRKRRKGRARTTSSSHSQSSRRTRLNSADSDLSSGEESIIMQSPPVNNQMCVPNRDSQFSPRFDTPMKDQDSLSFSRGSINQAIPTAADLLLALANSSVPGPSSPPLQRPLPSKSPTCDSGASSSSQSSTPSTPLSSACLLVAAAVGPLAPGFKFPKTKKVLMNEWLRESPDMPQGLVQMPHHSPNTSTNSVPSPNHQMPSGRPSDFLSPTDPSPEFLTQSYAAKGLATLVQAANSVSGICDSPPQRKQAVAVATTGCPVSSGSAKKRWLRQAISEECDSPNSRPESPPSEMVAPPKKRRFARESISSDNYTPPTTPTHFVSDNVAINATLGGAENDFAQQPQSPMSLDGPNVKIDYESEPMKEDTNSESEKSQFYETIKVESDKILAVKKEEDDYIEQKSIVSMKNQEDSIIIDTKDQVKEEEMKDEKDIVESLTKIETELEIKKETDPIEPTKCPSPVNCATNESCPLPVDESSMEIVNDTQMNEIEESSTSHVPIDHQVTESKQCETVVTMNLSGNTTDITDHEYENYKFEKEQKTVYNKMIKSDDTMSIDEFDVEAQMKKITGDDGNDYKEKVDTNSDKDKSMDGIEGLMDSSKEDSESEDRDFDSLKVNEEPRRFKELDRDIEERAFKELESLSNSQEFTKDSEDGSLKCLESTKPEQTVLSSEESIFDSVSSNIDSESIMEAPKIFHSIPPLSERIRKKDSSTQPKKSLDFEAAMIESTIDMECVEISENGSQKTELSTALRELLEAKIDEEPSTFSNNQELTENINSSQIFDLNEGASAEKQRLDDITRSMVISESLIVEQVAAKPVTPPQPEISRLKDPRRAIPNEMRIPSPKQDSTPVKRKLSISEYRKRKQQSSETTTDPEPTNDTPTSDKSPGRGRSDSASSGTSSLSSDEDNAKVTNDLPSLTTLPLFANADLEERKGGEDGTIGWSAAPTLVERQRENLTERLKREFGLFLSDDEEERARKQGLTAEAILKARKEALPLQSAISGSALVFPQTQQLPPQPYIPPPGSAPIHYPPYQATPSPSLPGQYSNYPVTQTNSSTLFTAPQSTSVPTTVGKQAAQFLVPQAPPFANPYPPQLTTTSVTVPVQRFPPTTPPSAFNSSTPSQKPYYNHPHSTPRS